MSGTITKVSGPLVVARGLSDANVSDVVRVGSQRLIGEILNMTEVLEELMSGTLSGAVTPEIECPFPMYVLSNKSKLNGSGCILYQNLLRQIGENLDSDFYVLPSSIHEVLLIPTTDQNSFEELNNMVKEVNATQLANEEILSDHVYYYSREAEKLSM